MRDMSAHDGGLRAVRRWRLATFAASLSLTLTASVVSALGMVVAAPLAAAGAADQGPDKQSREPEAADPAEKQVEVQPEQPARRPGPAATRRSSGRSFWPAHQLHPAVERPRPPQVDEPAPPRASGHGRRVVFDQSDQRVWLVGRSGSTRATYLVSGSRMDNLQPGAYEVYSRSMDAVGFNYQSTMRYMVRFTQGDNAAIGFHDIPVDDADRRVQTADQLGTALSSGCIRQRPRDARQMWDFAGLGTTVVVVA